MFWWQLHRRLAVLAHLQLSLEMDEVGVKSKTHGMGEMGDPKLNVNTYSAKITYKPECDSHATPPSASLHLRIVPSSMHALTRWNSHYLLFQFPWLMPLKRHLHGEYRARGVWYAIEGRNSYSHGHLLNIRHFFFKPIIKKKVFFEHVGSPWIPVLNKVGSIIIGLNKSWQSLTYPIWKVDLFKY